MAMGAAANAMRPCSVFESKRLFFFLDLSMVVRLLHDDLRKISSCNRRVTGDPAYRGHAAYWSRSRAASRYSLCSRVTLLPHREGDALALVCTSTSEYLSGGVYRDRSGFCKIRSMSVGGLEYSS
jgi:hypothetical protein